MVWKRMMVQNRWHRKGISGVATEWVILAWWRVMVVPHRRCIRVVIRRHGVVAWVTMLCRRQLHEGRLARRLRIKVVGLEAVVHLAVLSEERLNYNSPALADVQIDKSLMRTSIWVTNMHLSGSVANKTRGPRVLWLICIFAKSVVAQEWLMQI